MPRSGVFAIENMEAAVDYTGVERMQAQWTNRKKSFRHWILLLLNILALATGATVGPLLTKFYFLKGGSKLWLRAWLQTSGWPLLLLPLYLSYRKQPNRENHITPNLFLASGGIGILTGADNYLFTYGYSFLPFPTSSLLVSAQIGFIVIFALLLVRQKFNAFSINSVVLLTASSFMLAFHANHDRPEGVTHSQYKLGFLLSLGAAALYGFVIPLLEFIYRKTKRQITYMLVMEMEFTMSVFATVFCTVGMLINGEFQTLHREANEFRVGKINYLMVLSWPAVTWQLFSIGMFGVTFMANSMLTGVILGVTIPLTGVMGMVFFHEKFIVDRGMALLLALWGLTSYLYGEYFCYLKLQPAMVPNQQNN